METVTIFTITLLICFVDTAPEKRADDKFCHLNDALDILHRNTKMTLKEIKSLKRKLLHIIHPGQAKKRNGCQLAEAYMDSTETLQKLDVTKRMDFNSKVIRQYLSRLNIIKVDETKTVRKESFLIELNKTMIRMVIDTKRTNDKRKELSTYPCLGTKDTVTLWRTFAPVYPNVNPAPCNRNKDDEILTIVQDIEAIYRHLKVWYSREYK